MVSNDCKFVELERLGGGGGVEWVGMGYSRVEHDNVKGKKNNTERKEGEKYI